MSLKYPEQGKINSQNLKELKNKSTKCKFYFSYL